MTSSLPQSRPLIVDADEAEQFLLGLDIELSSVIAALETGDKAAINASTKYHPNTAAGLSRWIEMVRTLRLSMDKAGGWCPADEQNRPTSYHPSRNLTLSIVAGDEFTGSRNGTPNSIRALGRRARETADENVGRGGTPALFPVEGLRKDQPRITELEPVDGNWFLLYHRTEDELRAEISLPLGSREGRVHQWQIRVLLESYLPDGAKITTRPQDAGGQDVAFDIEDFGELG